MPERTESDIINQSPLMVKLGGKEYGINPLVIKDARLWRSRCVDVLTSLPDYVHASSDEPDEFNTALRGLLCSMQDIAIDLFFEYAKDLPREEIEASATEEEVADAFSRVIEVAFPLAGSLPEIRSRLFR